MPIEYFVEPQIDALPNASPSPELPSESSSPHFSTLNIKLDECKKRSQELYDFNPCLYFTLDKNHLIKALNYKAADFLGIKRHYLIGKSFLSFIGSQFQSLWQQHFDALDSKKPLAACEIEMLSKKGTRRFVSIEMHKKEDQCIHLQVKDITHYRQLEQQLLDMNKSLHLIDNLFQRSSDAVAALNNDLIFQTFNLSYAELFSRIFFTKLHVGMSLKHILVDFPDLNTRIIEVCQQALMGKNASIMVENQTSWHENYYCYELHFQAIDNPYHQIMFHIRNFSHYKREENLQRKQQAQIANAGIASAMGELASALAHEINQPLTAIIAYSRACILKFNALSENNNRIHELTAPLEQIALQAEHAGTIIHRMKNLMREGSCHFEETDIHLLLKETLSFLNVELAHSKLEIVLQFAENLPLLKIDKVQIMQVILNLARNSIEALQLTPHPQLTIETQAQQGHVKIHFRDNGPGIPEQFKTKILTSYFSTKPQGTGLGLAICQTLIGVHGGQLEVVDHTDIGSWLTVTLPIIRSL